MVSLCQTGLWWQLFLHSLHDFYLGTFVEISEEICRCSKEICLCPWSIFAKVDCDGNYLLGAAFFAWFLSRNICRNIRRDLSLLRRNLPLPIVSLRQTGLWWQLFLGDCIHCAISISDHLSKHQDTLAPHQLGLVWFNFEPQSPLRKILGRLVQHLKAPWSNACIWNAKEGFNDFFSFNIIDNCVFPFYPKKLPFIVFKSEA